jgi:hypothetical protein
MIQESNIKKESSNTQITQAKLLNQIFIYFVRCPLRNLWLNIYPSKVKTLNSQYRDLTRYDRKQNI